MNALTKAKEAKEIILNEKNQIENSLKFSLTENNQLRKALGATVRTLTHRDSHH